jgi:hypothetical protein
MLLNDVQSESNGTILSFRERKRNEAPYPYPESRSRDTHIKIRDPPFTLSKNYMVVIADTWPVQICIVLLSKPGSFQVIVDLTAREPSSDEVWLADAGQRLFHEACNRRTRAD